MVEVADRTKHDLELGIARFFDVMFPNCFVDGFVLIAQIRTPETEVDNGSDVKLVVQRDQSYVVTRGLTEEALDFLKVQKLAG